MDRSTIYRMTADIALMAHVAFVAFVILGLMVIVIGGLRGWAWTRNPWFRTVHVGAIGVVVLQAWFGIVCPLTTLEMALRERAGDPTTYAGTFVAHWLQTLLYYEAPPWMFVVGYTVFSVAVMCSWLGFPPRPFTRNCVSANVGHGQEGSDL